MSIRTEKVGRLVQRELASILNSHFQGLSRGIITVTKVLVTRDLSIARVYVSILTGTDEDRDNGFQALENAGSEIRGMLGSRIRHQVRMIPELRFFLDSSLDHVDKIEGLISDANIPDLDSELDASPDDVPEVENSPDSEPDSELDAN